MCARVRSLSLSFALAPLLYLSLARTNISAASLLLPAGPLPNKPAPFDKSNPRIWPRVQVQICKIHEDVPTPLEGGLMYGVQDWG